MVTTVWSVAVALALLGLGLFLWTILRRATPAWACLRCKYDLRGNPAAKLCPECGTPVDTGRRSWRRRVVVLRWLLIPLGLTLMAPPVLLWKPRWAEAVLGVLLPKRTLIVSKHFGDVRVRIYGCYQLPFSIQQVLSEFGISEPFDLNESRVIVESGSRVVFEHLDPMLWLGDSGPNGAGPTWGVNQDIDGDSVPDLVIQSYSGGAHCCSSCFVIRLGPDPRVIAEFHDNNGGPSLTQITRPEGQSQTLFTLGDDIWLYWHASYVDSAHPRVVFRLSRGTLSLATDQMAKPLPAKDKLDQDLARIRKAIPACLGTGGKSALGDLVSTDCADLWRIALDLLYSGHDAEGFAFLDQGWPEGTPGKEQFINEFKANLESSAYWPKIREAFAAHPPPPP